MALILKKGLFLTNFSHFLVTREKIEKFLQHMSYLHKNTYLAHHFYFFALPILQKKKKNTNLSYMVSLWYASWCGFLRIRAILEQSMINKMVHII